MVSYFTICHSFNLSSYRKRRVIKMVLSKLVIWLLVFFPKISKGSEENLFQYSDLKNIVCTSKDGCFKGKLEDNGDHTAWYGIPYAAPPVDQLRFQVK